MEKYYKDIEASLFKVKTCQGWFIQADTIEDALGLANKRGDYKLEDLEQIGTSVAILGTSPKYEDVINMRDQLERAWALLGHEDAALTLCDVSQQSELLLAYHKWYLEHRGTVTDSSPEAMVEMYKANNCG